MNNLHALRQYQQVDLQSKILKADAHQLIQMLFDGAIERLVMAKGHMERKEHEQSGKKISLAIGIIGGLQGSLELKVGGEVAENLFVLYEYMQNRLIEANGQQDTNMIQEVIDLIKEIKASWEKIPEILANEQTSKEAV